MLKRLTTTFTAAALALTAGFTAPARAGNDDLFKLLLGAAAVGVVLHQANRGGFAARAATPDHAVPQRYRDDWRDDRHRDRDRDRARARAVPASCLFDLPGRYGPRPVLGERCVTRWDRRVDLPQACAFDIRPGRGERRVYGLSCLRERGFRVVRG